MFVFLPLLDQEQIFFFQIFENVHQLRVRLEKHFVVIVGIVYYVTQLLGDIEIVLNFTKIIVLVVSVVSVFSPVVFALLVLCYLNVNLVLVLLLPLQSLFFLPSYSLFSFYTIKTFALVLWRQLVEKVFVTHID